MYYHAKLEYEVDAYHCWWNNSMEELIQTAVVPYVNGQVVLVNSGGVKKIINMKNVSLFSLYKTESKLVETEEKSIISQIGEADFLENVCTSEVLSSIRIDKSVSQSTSLIQKSTQITKEQVFVIMKFGDEVLDSAYDGVYKPIIESLGLKCLRIDEIQDSGKITDQILDKISESKYIIADLTGERPNCYYECGFAHALGK